MRFEKNDITLSFLYILLMFIVKYFTKRRSPYSFPAIHSGYFRVKRDLVPQTLCANIVKKVDTLAFNIQNCIGQPKSILVTFKCQRSACGLNLAKTK